MELLAIVLSVTVIPKAIQRTTEANMFRAEANKIRQLLHNTFVRIC